MLWISHEFPPLGTEQLEVYVGIYVQPRDVASLPDFLPLL